MKEAITQLTGLFQSTLPGRGATAPDALGLSLLDISIHAPREGSDLRAASVGVERDISIHAPREGSDLPRLA